MYEVQTEPYADMPKAVKELSPVDSALNSLSKEQDATHQLLDKLQGRLSGVLRAQPPTPENAAGISEAPQSPLHEQILAKRDTTNGLNRRITDLIQRLTV